MGDTLVSASWLVPVEGPPVEGGGVVCSGDRVVAVGPERELAREFPAAVRSAWPGCALVPGWVNAHAHLELTDLGDPPPAGDFVGWVLEVIRRKRAAPRDGWARAVARGARRCLALGQTTVADVAGCDGGAAGYPVAGRWCAFPEVIAERPDQVASAVARAEARAPRHRWGLSPHAPYTVCAEAVAAVRERGGRLMVHVAESLEEIAFCLTGGGAIRDRLFRAIGQAPPRVPGCHPVTWLDRADVLTPATILVHCVHVEPDHLAVLRSRGVGVVLCPRSNRHLSGAKAPGRALLDAGVAVGLGTDSPLSSGGLDLLDEMRAAVEDYGWRPEEAVRAATRGGGAVLGLGRDAGTFVPGARADMLALPLGPGRDPWERVLAGERPAAVWAGGQEVAGGTA